MIKKKNQTVKTGYKKYLTFSPRVLVLSMRLKYIVDALCIIHDVGASSACLYCACNLNNIVLWFRREDHTS